MILETEGDIKKITRRYLRDVKQTSKGHISLRLKSLEKAQSLPNGGKETDIPT